MKATRIIIYETPENDPIEPNEWVVAADDGTDSQAIRHFSTGENADQFARAEGRRLGLPVEFVPYGDICNPKRKGELEYGETDEQSTYRRVREAQEESGVMDPGFGRFSR